ncbi:MAG: CDP-alcohol phosphatidyltransferase family protein, partial [Deltaproteobacteria bacterium]
DDVRTPAALALPRAPERVPGDADALGELAQRLDREGRLQRVEVRGVCRRVRDGRQARRATRDLLAQMWRPTDGFFARHFDRYLSTAMSPWFVRWGVRPNTITLVATAVGLLGAVLLAQVRAAASVAGALLVVASTILDGCDGEVARISLRASPNGRRLDLLGDNVVNVAVFAAVGFHVVASAPAMVWVSTAAVLGIVVAAATGLWFSTWLDRAGLGERARAWYERASSRDFVYLVFALAVCDRLQWFVWMSAFGSFAFAAGLVVLRVGIDRHRRRSRAYKTVRGDV